MTVLDLLDSPIAYHRCFVPIGGVTGAVFLSQAIYWQKRVTREDGYFYKTADEWESETGLTQREQATARKRLVEAGVLIEKKSGVPCKLHFKIDTEILFQQIRDSSFDKSAKLESTNPQNKNEQIRKTITENTTKTTTETTHIAKRAEEVCAIWNEIFNTKVLVDSSLERKIRERLSEYSIEQIREVFYRYSMSLVESGGWVRNKKTLFSFIVDNNYGFYYFFHETDDSVKKYDRDSKVNNATVTRTGTGVFA